MNKIKELMTVAEVQEILCVSKKAIYDKINKSEFEDLIVKIKGVKYIKLKGVKKLKESFGKASKAEILEEFESVEKAQSEIVKNVFEEVDYKEELIIELREKIKFLENENIKLFDLIGDQNSIMKQQNNIIQNEQQITLNHTELLLVEKREVLKLRQEQYQKESKGIRKFLKIFK